MKNYLKFAIPIVFVLTIITIILFSKPMPGEMLKVQEFTTATVESFKIGANKEAILAHSLNQSFSPLPKPMECPSNWISANNMSETQKGCLIATDEWKVGLVEKSLCPEKTDHHVTLHFVSNTLSSVKVRCTVGK